MENLESKQKKPKTKFNNKHTDDLVDHYWASIGYLTELIKGSELKAGIILSFYGILLNFIYQSYNELSVYIKNDTTLTILIIIWLILTIGSIFFCIRCFIPSYFINIITSCIFIFLTFLKVYIWEFCVGMIHIGMNVRNSPIKKYYFSI